MANQNQTEKNNKNKQGDLQKILSKMKSANSDIQLSELLRSAVNIAGNNPKLVSLIEKQYSEASQKVGFKRYFKNNIKLKVIEDSQESRYIDNQENNPERFNNSMVLNVVKLTSIIFKIDPDSEAIDPKMLENTMLILKTISNPELAKKEEVDSILKISEEHDLGIEFDKDNKLKFKKKEHEVVFNCFLSNIKELVVKEQANQIASEIIQSMDPNNISIKELITPQSKVMAETLRKEKEQLRSRGGLSFK